MSLKSNIPRAELAQQQAELTRAAEILKPLEAMSPDERIALWKDLIERTKQVLDTAGRSFTPNDGHYNAHSEGDPILIAEEDGVQRFLRFNISHEPRTGKYHPHDQGVRWLTVIQMFRTTTGPEASQSGGLVHLSAFDCIDSTSLELPEYMEALKLAEATTGIR